MMRTPDPVAPVSELKFLVPPAVALRIRERVRDSFEPDPHGGGRFGDEYDVSTLYFDTRHLDVFQQRGSYGRAKYRIRRYGTADVVFLERKLRRPGILIKRRTSGPLDGLDRFASEQVSGAWFGEWFHRRVLLRRLRPMCEISYRRLARTLHESGSRVRLTLDSALRARAIGEARFSGEPGSPFLESHWILELKYQKPLPAACRRLVEDFALEAQRASKYRLGMEALGVRSLSAPGPQIIDRAVAHA